jgi:hypothetical protein
MKYFEKMQIKPGSNLAIHTLFGFKQVPKELEISVNIERIWERNLGHGETKDLMVWCNFSSVYWIFTKLDHMIALWKRKNPIYFGVIRSKVTITIDRIFDNGRILWCTHFLFKLYCKNLKLIGSIVCFCCWNFRILIFSTRDTKNEK